MDRDQKIYVQMRAHCDSHDGKQKDVVFETLLEFASEEHFRACEFRGFTGAATEAFECDLPDGMDIVLGPEEVRRAPGGAATRVDAHETEIVFLLELPGGGSRGGAPLAYRELKTAVYGLRAHVAATLIGAGRVRIEDWLARMRLGEERLVALANLSPHLFPQKPRAHTWTDPMKWGGPGRVQVPVVNKDDPQRRLGHATAKITPVQLRC